MTSRTGRLSRYFLRYYSQKYDPMILAEALGLLSPTRSANDYKPSILRNLQKGPVTEHYNEIKSDLLPHYEIPLVDHRKNMGRLIEDLQAAVGMSPRKVTMTKDIKDSFNSLTSEDELLDLLRLSFYQNELTPQLLNQILLNPNIQNLSRLPFDVESLDKTAFKKNGWLPIHFTQFQILLMKKYYDLKKPLQIVKLLNNHFVSTFFPLIQKGELLPFYERIVWKFCFEYLEQYEESAMIEDLYSLRSSVLIWEASLEENCAVAQKILTFHALPPLTRLFFELAACKPLQLIINAELQSQKSPTLSELKKISSKSKLYKIDKLSTVIERALAYSLIHSLDQFLDLQALKSNDPAVFQEFISKLALQRMNMLEQSESLDLAQEDKVYTN